MRKLNKVTVAIQKENTSEFLNAVGKFYKKKINIPIECYLYRKILSGCSSLKLEKIGQDRTEEIISPIKSHFESESYEKVLEVGGGYGRRALVVGSVLSIERYKMFDLSEVRKLISKHLECFVLNGSYSASTLDKSTSESYNIIISKYAFSYVTSGLQKHTKKVMS